MHAYPQMRVNANTHSSHTYTHHTLTVPSVWCGLLNPLQVVFPLGLPVSRDPRGVFVLLSLLDLFSQRIWDDPVNCPLALQVGARCWGV